jgi:hypothetical protein
MLNFSWTQLCCYCYDNFTFDTINSKWMTWVKI